MSLSPEEQAIKDALDVYVADKPFVYNPNDAFVEKIIQGLAKRKAESGLATCPCRMATGKEDLDKKIVCPCEYHEQEIAEQGHCHCYLFVAEKDE